MGKKGLTLRIEKTKTSEIQVKLRVSYKDISNSCLLYYLFPSPSLLIIRMWMCERKLLHL